MLKREGILFIAISTLLLPVANAATPRWECQAGAGGGWQCAKDGQPVAEEQTELPAIDVEPTQTEPLQERITSEPEPLPQSNTITTETTTEPAPVTDVSTPAETTPPPEPAVVEESPQPPAAETESGSETATTTAQQDSVTTPVPIEEPAAIEQETSIATTKPLTEPQQVSSLPSSGEHAYRIDRDLNWNQCSGPLNDPAASAPMVSQTEISADGADLQQREDIAIFSGNAEVLWKRQRLEAAEVRYSRKDNTLDARGPIYYQTPGLLMSANSAHLELATDRGRLENTEYRLPQRRGRGSAAVTTIEDSDRTKLTDLNYTTCAPGDDGWQLKASELELDRASGVGTARHTTLEFQGVPFLYLPYVTFPIDDRRKSGFLIPTLGHSSETGVDIATPYYFNIAPNMDATFIPRYMSERGLMLGGEFRYLGDWYYSETRGEIIPDDRKHDANEDNTRGTISHQGYSPKSNRWQVETDINYASDSDYLDDLGGSLAVSSAQHLERRGDLRYWGEGWDFLARLQYFQNIDEARPLVDQPYAKLPQLLLNLERDSTMGLRLHLDSEYVYFDRRDSVHGHRFDFHPGVSLPLSNSWGYLTPKISGRYTSYGLADEGAGNPDSPNRTLYTFSLDSGLTLDRRTNWFGRNLTQTLEPRLFYLYTKRKNQDDLPIFDTTEVDFSFARLFRENRFNGIDRIGDANQLTAALTSRTMDDSSGEELFRASIGQILYFNDREVQLPGVADIDESSSAVVAEIAARLTDNWSLRGTMQWDPHADDNHTRQSAIHLNYLGDSGGIFNLAHRYRVGLIEQSDLSLRWPITHRINAVARWNYSWRKRDTLESFAGIEYDSCCWAVRAVARHYINDDGQDENTSFMLQLELKGLTGIGHRVDRFLEDGILGYETD